MKLKKTDFQRNLLAWYDENKKNLPWRNDTEPYHIWISEIMSQQTQVETVIPYYLRFMTKYPTIADLANANDDELLKIWEGLGYYSRARNLKIAANQIMTEFDGKFPSDLTAIKSLKGIGPYTAAAISSISFGQAEPAIDGNLLRVTARIFQLSDDIANQKSRKVFDEKLRELISQNRPGDFNQALMDIGSTVCTPKIAKCEICPLTTFCQAFANGNPLDFPVKSKKIKVKNLFYAAYVVKNSLGEYYFEKRAETGLLANMWIFPLVEISKADFEQFASGQKAPELLTNLPDTLSKLTLVGQIKHVFSHQKWHIVIFDGQPEENFIQENELTENQIWLSNLTEIPLAGPTVKMLELLENDKM